MSKVLDTIGVSVGDSNQLVTVDTSDILSTLGEVLYSGSIPCASGKNVSIDKGWLKEKAKEFLSQRDSSDTVASLEALFEEFVNFLEI